MNSSELAHEIINPLNIIVGCVELFKLKNINQLTKNKHNEETNTKLIDYLDEIIKQSLWCCEILQSNINENKNIRIDISKLISNIISDIYSNPLKQKKNVKINYKYDNEDNFNIMINKAYIKITVKNLIMNSLKYCPNNGIINVKLSSGKYNVVILITNNIKKKIDTYNNANTDVNTDLDFIKSNGYGLNVVDELINKMSGDWNITNNKNIYKVILTLPKSFSV